MDKYDYLNVISSIFRQNFNQSSGYPGEAFLVYICWHFTGFIALSYLQYHLLLKLFFYFCADLGSNNSGYYTLQAVLTHKGRLSSSGHYVAWVRSPSNPSMWIKFDDDVVTPITLEEVLKLSGGGKHLSTSNVSLS